MRRRDILAALSTATASALAGCSSQLPGDGSDSTPTQTEEPNPQVQFHENWTENGYEVVVNVQLNGAEQVYINQGIAGEQTVRTVTSSGNYTIAGSNTSYGTADMSTTFIAARPGERINQTLAQHVVGSQEQPSTALFLNGLHGSTDPNVDESGVTTQEYTIDTPDGVAVLTLRIPNVLQSYYERRLRVPDYGVYVSDTYDDQYISSGVATFENFTSRQGGDDRYTIENMMRFVQNLEYTSDEVSAGYNEYPKYPVETLTSREGDCEDTCILLASLLNQLGYGSVLLVFREEQHMALGLAGEDAIEGTYFEQDGQRYYYVETTAPGWGIGEAPQEMQNADAELVPVNSSGVLVFSYAIQTGVGSVDAEITMRNVGDAPGQARAEVAFEDRSGNIVASAQSNPTQIAPEQEASVTLSPSPPDDRELRARVIVALDGTPQDSLTSEWRTPQSTS